jgi:PAS domain S-box-containing protein
MWPTLVHPDDLQRELVERNRAIAEHRPFDLEFRILHASGEVRWLSAKGGAVYDEDGHPVRVFGVNMDITARKQAEEALRENEAKYKALIETTQTGYVIIDAEGRVLDANNEYVRLSGHQRREEILGRKVTEWTAPHDLKRNAEAVRSCAVKGFVHNLEMDYVNRAGQITPVEINATVLSALQPAIILSLVRDITERKQTEERLHQLGERERFLADVVENAEVPFGCGAPDLTPPQWRAAEAAHLAEARRTRQSVHYEKQYLRKDGTLVPIELWVQPIFDADGQLLHYRSFLSDITERKRAEEALHDSEERYRLLADNAEDFISLEDLEGNHLYISPSYYRVTGWTPEELAVSNWRTRMHPDDFPNIERAKAAATAGETATVEHRIRCRDGSWIWVSQHIKPLFDATGKVHQIMFWANHITARKEAEDALRQSEERFRHLAEAMPQGVWIRKPNGESE